MNAQDFLLQLTREALADLEAGELRIAVAMKRAIRLARLRSDWEAVYWLSVELEPLADKEARYRRIAEVAPHLTRDELKRIHDKAIEQSIASRAIGYIDERGRPREDKITSLSVPELEAFISATAVVRREPLPANLHPYDAAALSEKRRELDQRMDSDLVEMRKVLARLGQRTHAYISRVEQQLFFGYEQADFVSHNRRFVDGRLAVVCPDGLEQLRAAQRRAAEGTAEARSHALTSCRRALKSLADWLYPARPEPIRGADGRERLLDDSKFVNRIWQFVADSTARPTARKLIQGEIEQIGATVDRLNDLSSKGVHDQVTPLEVHACLASLYNLAGALIRLHDEVSGASIDPDTLVPLSP